MADHMPPRILSLVGCYIVQEKMSCLVKYRVSGCHLNIGILIMKGLARTRKPKYVDTTRGQFRLKSTCSGSIRF